MTDSFSLFPSSRDGSTPSSKRLSLDAPPLKRKSLSPPRYEVGGTETPVQYPPAWPIPSLSASATETGRHSFGSPGDGRLSLPSSVLGGIFTPALFRKPAPRSPASISTSRQRWVAKQAEPGVGMVVGVGQESFPCRSPLDPDQFFGLTPTKALPPPSARQSDEVAWGEDESPPRTLLPSNSLNNKRVSPSKMPRARGEVDDGFRVPSTVTVSRPCPGLLSP